MAIPFWADAIAKIENVQLAFKILPYETNTPIGYQFVQYHMVFNIKMKDFRGKG